MAPLDQSLEAPAEWARAFDGALALALARGWHMPALREYLPLWRARHRRADVPTFALDPLLEYARDRLSQVQEIEHSRERLEREDRLNGLTYLMDVLRDCPRDQALEIALRHIVHSGAHGALVALQVAERNLAVQYIDNGVVQQQWSGALAAFPPPGWLAAGELLILMPLAGGSAQRGVIGVIERAGRSQIDLDDLVLRSVNTYRATAGCRWARRSPAARRTERTLQLVPGDLLVLSTDGIVEAADIHGELYGFECFQAAISAGPSSSAEQLLAHLFADVGAFVGEGEARDDMTIVVVRYCG